MDNWIYDINIEESRYHKKKTSFEWLDALVLLKEKKKPTGKCNSIQLFWLLNIISSAVSF